MGGSSTTGSGSSTSPGTSGPSTTPGSTTPAPTNPPGCVCICGTPPVSSSSVTPGVTTVGESSTSPGTSGPSTSPPMTSMGPSSSSSPLVTQGSGLTPYKLPVTTTAGTSTGPVTTGAKG